MAERIQTLISEISYLCDAISGKVREVIYRWIGINNVRVVIGDQRVSVSTNGRTLVYYKLLVESIYVCYPFDWDKQLTTVNLCTFNYHQGQLFDKDLGNYCNKEELNKLEGKLEVAAKVEKYLVDAKKFLQRKIANSKQD